MAQAMIKWLVLAVLVAACGKDKAASPRDKVIEAWKAGGLAPSSFTSAQVSVGQDCATGMVGGLDVLVCVFGTPTQAQGAEEAGYNWVGANTGSVQAKGSVLIAVADRKKADPSGKTINQMMKLAPK
jgi:hypothetical protein